MNNELPQDREQDGGTEHAARRALWRQLLQRLEAAMDCESGGEIIVKHSLYYKVDAM